MSLQGPYGQPPQKKGLSTGCIVGIVVVAMGVVILPILGFLGIYGVRRYIASAKTAEARNTVGAIARAAATSYDGHGVLCGTASPVPSSLSAVSAKKYVPTSADFDTGSDTAGWKCLRFALTMPSYYQYHYHAGSGYLTPAGASAGAKGFEAAAMGDLNGDGTPSHFARSGTLDASGHVQLSTEIYIDNEFE